MQFVQTENATPGHANIGAIVSSNKAQGTAESCILSSCILSSCLSRLWEHAGGDHGSHRTGSTTENAKSYIPGTDANRESRHEQGRDTGRDSSYGRDHDQGYGDNRGECDCV